MRLRTFRRRYSVLIWALAVASERFQHAADGLDRVPARQQHQNLVLARRNAEQLGIGLRITDKRGIGCAVQAGLRQQRAGRDVLPAHQHQFQ